MYVCIYDCYKKINSENIPFRTYDLARSDFRVSHFASSQANYAVLLGFL